jgi:hypothetical protein
MCSDFHHDSVLIIVTKQTCPATLPARWLVRVCCRPLLLPGTDPGPFLGSSILAPTLSSASELHSSFGDCYHNTGIVQGSLMGGCTSGAVCAVEEWTKFAALVAARSPPEATGGCKQVYEFTNTLKERFTGAVPSRFDKKGQLNTWVCFSRRFHQTPKPATPLGQYSALYHL